MVPPVRWPFVKLMKTFQLNALQWLECKCLVNGAQVTEGQAQATTKDQSNRVRQRRSEWLAKGRE